MISLPSLPVIRRSIASGLGAACLLGIAACQSRSDTGAAAVSYKREYPSDSGHVKIELEAPALIALGDTAHAEVTRYHCSGNQCDGVDPAWPAAGASWRVEPASAADVTARGHITPRRVGVFRLTTARADTVLSQRIEVLPPVAQLAWEPAPQQVFVGDTIRTHAVAQDSAGRVIRVIRESIFSSDSRSIRIRELASDGPQGTAMVAEGPGEFELTARIGARSAVLRTRVEVPVSDTDLPILPTRTPPGGNACRQIAGQRPESVGDDTIARAAWRRAFARGAEYRCVIQAKMPPIRLVIVGDAEGEFFDSLVVEPDRAGAPPYHIPRQSLLIDIEFPPPGNTGIVQMFDIDADGYNDLLVANMWGATGNTLYDVWRFNRHMRQFVADDELSRDVNLTPIPGVACVHTSVNNGGFADNETTRRCLRNGHWVTDSVKTSRWDERAHAVVEEIQVRKGDSLVVVKRTVRREP